MKTLLTTTALGLSLAITPAIAAPQTSPDSSPATQSQDSTMPSAPAAPDAGNPAAAPEAPSGATGMSPDSSTDTSAVDKPDKQQSSFMTSQSPDDKLASNLIGKTVYNANNEEIGEIEDLVLTNDGRIVAAIVETGSFMGLGGKQVAVSFDTLQFSRGEDSETRVTMNVAQERLNSAPEFKTLDEQSTGAAGTAK